MAKYQIFVILNNLKTLLMQGKGMVRGFEGKSKGDDERGKGGGFAEDI